MGRFYCRPLDPRFVERTVDRPSAASHHLRQRRERLMSNPVANYKMIVKGAPFGGAVWYRSLVQGGVLLHKRNAIGGRQSLTS